MHIDFDNMPVTTTSQRVLKLVINIRITALLFWYHAHVGTTPLNHSQKMLCPGIYNNVCSSP